MDIQKTTEELESLRKESENIKQQKSKLEGELNSLQERVSELEKRALEEIGVDISKLPDLVKEYEEKITTYMIQIKQKLRRNQ